MVMRRDVLAPVPDVDLLVRYGAGDARSTGTRRAASARVFRHAQDA
jgi:hypothetical protein